MSALWIAAKTIFALVALLAIWVIGIGIAGYVILVAFSYVPLVGRRGKRP